MDEFVALILLVLFLAKVIAEFRKAEKRAPEQGSGGSSCDEGREGEFFVLGYYVGSESQECEDGDGLWESSRND